MFPLNIVTFFIPKNWNLIRISMLKEVHVSAFITRVSINIVDNQQKINKFKKKRPLIPRIYS